MKLAVAIATTGRRDILSQTVASLAQQTRPAEVISICAVKPGDVDEDALRLTGLPIDVAYSAPGLTRQRNVLLDKLGGYDVVVFFDDDFLPAPTYLAEIERLFREMPDVAMITGTVLADGARNAGIALDQARDLIARDAPVPLAVETVFSGYGCNMAIRLSVLREHRLSFDEELPLYCWLEDMDVSRALARHGRVVRASTPRGVHLAIKNGRGPDLRLGYSQVANPIYLHRKGRIPLSTVLSHAGRNIVSNAVKVFTPEPYIDRWARVRGNWRAVGDLLRGRLHPKVILGL